MTDEIDCNEEEWPHKERRKKERIKRVVWHPGIVIPITLALISGAVYVAKIDFQATANATDIEVNKGDIVDTKKIQADLKDLLSRQDERQQQMQKILDRVTK